MIGLINNAEVTYLALFTIVKWAIIRFSEYEKQTHYKVEHVIERKPLYNKISNTKIKSKRPRNSCFK